MHPPTNPTEIFGRIVAVALLAVMPLACMESLDRQAHADYQECLSWQADGYPVKCDVEKYR